MSSSVPAGRCASGSAADRLAGQTTSERRFDFPAGDVGAALAAAPRLGDVAAALGPGHDSARYTTLLRRLGAFDLTSARVIEPHLDATCILGQAQTSASALGLPGESVLGVFASRAPQLHALDSAHGWTLRGHKPWCSLGGVLSHALITAGSDDGQRLFLVDLRRDDVTASEEPWVARGLAHIRSTGLDFDDTPATPIGGPGFYLERDGLAWGGIGVAAVWAGGVEALAETVRASLTRGSREPDQIALMHVGRLDVLTHVLDVTFADAAAAIDVGRAAGRDGRLLAGRVRAVAARAAEEALTIVGRALGPGPLAGDETHARRVADLTLYVRQHHAERDLATQGRQVLERGRA